MEKIKKVDLFKDRERLLNTKEYKDLLIEQILSVDVANKDVVVADFIGSEEDKEIQFIKLMGKYYEMSIEQLIKIHSHYYGREETLSLTQVYLEDFIKGLIDYANLDE